MSKKSEIESKTEALLEPIAKANGVVGYRGTAAQNTGLLNLLKQGKLKKA